VFRNMHNTGTYIHMHVNASINQISEPIEVINSNAIDFVCT